MSTPKPLIESSSLDHARELLRAARADGPRPGAAGRALTALGVVGTTATAAGAATAAASTSAAGLGGAASLPMIAAKWLLVGTLCGGALASGSSLVFSPTAPRPSAGAPQAKLAPSALATTPAEALARPAHVPPKPARVAAPEPAPATDKAPKPSLATPASSVVEATPQPASAPSQAAFASPEQSKLLHDVALLDDARRALRASDTARALSLLTRYDAERQTHILDREAQLLRIDVLAARGERARARELAQEYLTTFPNDAHAEHLRALAGVAPGHANSVITP